RGREALTLQTLTDEVVDRIVEFLGDLNPPRRYERPVLLPLRALLDPAADQVDLGGAVRPPGIRGRHPHRRILGRNAADHLAAPRIARHDGEPSAQVALGDRFDVESQRGFAITLVRTVAGVTLVGKDGADVAVESHSSAAGQ